MKPLDKVDFVWLVFDWNVDGVNVLALWRCQRPTSDSTGIKTNWIPSHDFRNSILLRHHRYEAI